MTGIIPPNLALRMTIVRGITVLNPPVTAAIGVAYSHTFRAFGGTAPYTWEMVSELPTGWSFDPATATLTNPSPDTAGSFEITLYVRDATWDYELPVTFTVNIIALPVQITNGLPSYTAGVAQNFTYTSTGGVGAKTFAVTSGALPPGLTLSTAGVLTGTTTGLGAPGTYTFNFTVTATDTLGSQGSIGQSVTVTVVAISVTNSAPAGTSGTPYSHTYTSSGGTGTKTWSKLSGTLPPGLALSNGGVLSGTPTAAGTYNFVVQVVDAAGTAATRNQSITLAYPAIATTGNFKTNITAGSTVSTSIAISGGNGVYSNARLTSGTLPPGWNPSVSGSSLVLSGTLTASGSYTFTVAVDSGDGQTASKTQTVTIFSIDAFDPVTKGAAVTLSNSNYTMVRTGTSFVNYQIARSVRSRSTGKYYFEFAYNRDANNFSSFAGLCTDDWPAIASGYTSAAPSTSVLISLRFSSNASNGLQTMFGVGVNWNGLTITSMIPGTNLDNTHRAMIAIDFDAGKVWIGIDGTWISGTTWGSGANPAAGTTPTFTFPANTPLRFMGLSPFANTESTVFSGYGSPAYRFTPPAGFENW